MPGFHFYSPVKIFAFNALTLLAGHDKEHLVCKLESPARGLTVIAASTHGLLRPTCNHNHKLLVSTSAEIKVSEFW